MNNLKKMASVALILVLTFANLSAQQIKKPKFDRTQIPTPVFDKNSGYVDLYWKAWELAWEKVKYQEGIPQSPYMDEGLWEDTIWIWDTEFMVLFCRYASELYPGIESLQNFYKVLLDKDATSLRIQHPDNPPFYAWVEYEYFKHSNDKKHLEQLIVKDKYLQRHFNWFENIKPGTKLHFKHAHIAAEKREKGYRWGGVQSGMDNTPRDYGVGKDLLWIDAIAQQALSALYISRLASEIDQKAIAKEYKARYKKLKKIVNENYWDEKDGFYYDIRESNGEFVKVKTPASFWVLLAEIPSKKQAARMAEYAANPKHFGGEFPWPTLSKQEPYFNKVYGDYWKGAIWLPTAYMATKSLEKYGLNELANQLSENLVSHMFKTYKQYAPNTIWECYSPSKHTPSFRCYDKEPERVREDFCGWSALGPISIFIENVIGFYDINAQKNVVRWNLHHKERNGMKGLRFGNTVADIIYEDGKVNVNTNAPFTLVVNGKKLHPKKGESSFKVKVN